MIIPIGHEHTTVRRLPWVTFAIMAICFAAFFMTLMSDASMSERQAMKRLQEAGEYWFEHSYLEPGDRLKQALSEGVRIDQQDAHIEFLRFGSGTERPSDRALISQQQAELDRMVDEAFETVSESPYFRWGLIPAHFSFVALFTHMFMHGGWIHLLGNMFFLYLAGPFIEDVWGRPIYISFYLLSGIIAALMFSVRYPTLEGPLIGASGAVAGVMGAFLIRYWKTKIRFFYWFGFIFRGTFSAPAWLMLPLWLLRELTFAQAMDVVARDSGGGGVAHWAHVWGFAFGMVVAVGMSHFKVEQKYLHKAIESKITLLDQSSLEEAMAARQDGRHDEALTKLREEVRRSPSNLDAIMAYWSVAVDMRAPEEAVPAVLRLIRDGVKRGEPELVFSYWEDLREHVPDARVEPVLAFRVAEMLGSANRTGEEVDALHVAFASSDPSTAAGLLLKIARAAHELEAPWAGEAVERCLAHPEMPPEAVEDLRGLAAKIAAAPPPPPEPRLDEPDVVPEVVKVIAFDHTLKLMSAIPVLMRQDGLKVKVGEAERMLPFERLQAVAVAGVTRPDGRPYLLVDLLLDGPWSDQKELRVIRMLSTEFDPRHLIPGSEDTLDAFRLMLDHILKASEAVPLPDPEGARGRPFRMFSSLEEYQDEVLGIS